MRAKIVKVCTAQVREHSWGPDCWCHPEVVRCEEHDGGCMSVGHAYVEARPDIRPRMAVFSS